MRFTRKEKEMLWDALIRYRENEGATDYIMEQYYKWDEEKDGEYNFYGVETDSGQAKINKWSDDVLKMINKVIADLNK